ncbi:PREDICTED: centromere protein V-like [Cercocebus atys]|uniref:centromere protein V-like n=1 Tax=Cercocebus atys TaxID=9531 RepID=UPI0005F3D6A2|nr:PREDICTED: centromere protein V-like [Cercocebus atys]
MSHLHSLAPSRARNAYHKLPPGLQGAPVAAWALRRCRETPSCALCGRGRPSAGASSSPTPAGGAQSATPPAGAQPVNKLRAQYSEELARAGRIPARTPEFRAQLERPGRDSTPNRPPSPRAGVPGPPRPPRPPDGRGRPAFRSSASELQLRA